MVVQIKESFFMALFEIKNEKALVTVDEHASEIHSFCDVTTDNEYMW